MTSPALCERPALHGGSPARGRFREDQQLLPDRGAGELSAAVLTVAEAAKRLERSPEFVRGLIADGVLPALLHRGRWYVAERDLRRIVPDAPGAVALPPADFPMAVKVKRRG
jgi:hypothetical protein